MRIKPLCISAAVALAFSGNVALAQTTSARTTTAGTTATTTGTTSTTGTTAASPSTSTTSTAVGGCAGSAGSSCSATNSNTAGTTATGTNTVTNTNEAVAAQVTPTTTTNTTSNNANVGDTTIPPRSAQGTNSVNADPTFTRPGPFDAGGAFGPAAVGTTTTGTETGTGGTLENGIVLGTSGTNPSSQQNVIVQPQQPQQGATVLSTPIFDQAAREGRAREARRRAQGNEPRVVGIAPRTDRDLTWQMPDDPIIRY